MSKLHYHRQQLPLSPAEARFVSYVNITLTFEAKRYAKRQRLLSEAQTSLPDNLDQHTRDAAVSEENDSVSRQLLDVVADPRLYRALRTLTPTQREILYRLVVLGHQERQIASDLAITQQAVNKSKNTALARLRSALGCAS